MASRNVGRQGDDVPGPSKSSWMVNLYRWTRSSGWEKQVPERVRVQHDGTEVVQAGKASSNDSFAIAVVPQRHHILFPDIQQKFTLVAKSESKSAPSTPPGENSKHDAQQQENSSDDHDAEDAWVKDRTTVIRREDRILLISRRRIQSMVIQFRNLTECLEFSDCFSELNKPMQDGPASSTSQDSQANPTSPTEDRLAIIKESANQGFQNHSQAVVSYITRLVHDENFLQFVKKLETSIDASKDGGAILDALATRPIHSKSPPTGSNKRKRG